MSNNEQQWNGVEGTGCEHRTVGYRAWCHDCLEWCYPEQPCIRCVEPSKDAHIAALEARVKALEEAASKYREGLEVIERLSAWTDSDLETAQFNAAAYKRDGDALMPAALTATPASTGGE